MALIEQADLWLFQLLNLHLVHPAVDDLLIFLTEIRLSGHILLLAVLFMVFRRGKSVFLVIVLAFCAVGLADVVAQRVFKVPDLFLFPEGQADEDE